MTNNPTIDGVSRVLLAHDREMRVYIAGPMTGIEDYNFPAFNAMAEKMRAAGWHVENPADHGLVIGAKWGDYLRYDIGCLASCEAIMLLPGWTASRGARLEVSIAKELGVAFMYAEGAEPGPAVERQESAVCSQIQALLDIDARGSLVPHGIGGLARDLLTKAQSTIVQLQALLREADDFMYIMTGDDTQKHLDAKYGELAWEDAIVDLRGRIAIAALNGPTNTNEV